MAKSLAFSPSTSLTSGLDRTAMRGQTVRWIRSQADSTWVRPDVGGAGVSIVVVFVEGER